MRSRHASRDILGMLWVWSCGTLAVMKLCHAGPRVKSSGTPSGELASGRLSFVVALRVNRDASSRRRSCECSYEDVDERWHWGWQPGRGPREMSLVEPLPARAVACVIQRSGTCRGECGGGGTRARLPRVEVIAERRVNMCVAVIAVDEDNDASGEERCSQRW